MSGKILKISLIGIIIITIVSYVWYFNQNPVTFNYSSTGLITAPLAMLVVFTFISGALFSAAISFIIGIKYYFRDWRRQKKHVLWENHQEQIINAREQLAANNLDAAHNTFQKIIDKDPSDIIARILLANTYQRQNDLDNALKTLDEARAEQKKNVELLFLAADINSQVGNFTAAYDNLSIILKSEPKNQLALRLIVEQCKGLGRYSEGVEFQRTLIRQSGQVDYIKNQEQLAELELLLAKKIHSNSPTNFSHALEDILRRHREFPPALAELALIEQGKQNLDKASKYYSKAYTGSKNIAYLESITAIWLGADNPQKAVQTVKALVLPKQTSDEVVDIDGVVFLIGMLVYLENIEEAKVLLNRLTNIKGLAQKQELAIMALHALYKQKSDLLEEAFDELYELLIRKNDIPGFSFLKNLFSSETENIWASNGHHSRVKLLSPPGP